MIEPQVQRLKAYCEQQQVIFAEDDDRRNAYNFVERHIIVMWPRSDALHAFLIAWMVDRRVRAQQVRARGVGLALAETWETSAAVYEELADRLQKQVKRQRKRGAR